MTTASSTTPTTTTQIKQQLPSSPLPLRPDFSLETLDGQATKIGKGAWVFGTDHTPGG